MAPEPCSSVERRETTRPGGAPSPRSFSASITFCRKRSAWYRSSSGPQVLSSKSKFSSVEKKRRRARAWAGSCSPQTSAAAWRSNPVVGSSRPMRTASWKGRWSSRGRRLSSPAASTAFRKARSKAPRRAFSVRLVSRSLRSRTSSPKPASARRPSPTSSAALRRTSHPISPHLLPRSSP